MLRACVLHYGKNWDKCLFLAEFSYNNSYQSSLKMAPFEALYGRRCRTPLNWSQAGEREIFGPDLVLEAEEKVRVIKKNLEAAQARQKSYHDKRRKPLQFEVGDHVYLKVSPTKGVQRFGIKGKLAPRYIGPEPELEIEPDLSYQEKPVKVLDQKERSTRARSIRMYKIQWSNHTEEEATWETKDFLRSRFPDFLPKGVGM
jgi:hypothetical protein